MFENDVEAIGYHLRLLKRLDGLLVGMEDDISELECMGWPTVMAYHGRVLEEVRALLATKMRMAQSMMGTRAAWDSRPSKD